MQAFAFNVCLMHPLRTSRLVWTKIISCCNSRSPQLSSKQQKTLSSKQHSTSSPAHALSSSSSCLSNFLALQMRISPTGQILCHAYLIARHRYWKTQISNLPNVTFGSNLAAFHSSRKNSCSGDSSSGSGAIWLWAKEFLHLELEEAGMLEGRVESYSALNVLRDILLRVTTWNSQSSFTK